MPREPGLGKKPWGHQHVKYEQKELLTATNSEKPLSVTPLSKKGGVHLTTVQRGGPSLTPKNGVWSDSAERSLPTLHSRKGSLPQEDRCDTQSLKEASSLRTVVPFLVASSVNHPKAHWEKDQMSVYVHITSTGISARLENFRVLSIITSEKIRKEGSRVKVPVLAAWTCAFLQQNSRKTPAWQKGKVFSPRG